MAVARQQQVIAIVDGEVGRGIEIGPAAAAGLLRSLVHAHLEARVGKPHRGREARNPSADNVNVLLHHRKA